MASLHRVESGAGLEKGGVLDENLDLPKLLLYGSGIYSALTLALHPLSVLKTRAQASTAPSSLSRGDALRAMLRTSGVRGLYAGLGPVILGAVPARAAYISVLEGTRPAARRGAAAAGLSGAAAVSAASGTSAFGAVLASQLVYVPVDVVTQKLMVAGDPHAAGAGAGAGEATAAQVVRAILKESGPLGLYRGFGVSLVAHLPGGSIWWASYAGARAPRRRRAARARRAGDRRRRRRNRRRRRDGAARHAQDARPARPRGDFADGARPAPHLGRRGPLGGRAGQDSPPRAVGRHHGVGLRGAQAAV